MADIWYGLNKKVEEGTSLWRRSKEFGSMCREYLSHLEQLQAEIEMQGELSFNTNSSENSSSGLGAKETVSGKSNDEQNVQLNNGNSNTVLCLRRRIMRMKDCVSDFKLINKKLGQLVDNEEAVKREMAGLRLNECKFNKRLDRVQHEKENLVDLLTWLKASNNYVSRVEKLVRQRFFGRKSRIPFAHRAPYNSEISGSRNNGSEN